MPTETPDRNASPTTATGRAPSRKKFGILAALVLLVIAGWSAFWYVSYTQTQQLVDRLMARQINGTQLLQCEDQHLGGYPFRLFLSCSSFSINDPRSGWQAEGGALRAIWQVYSPDLALVEAESHLDLLHSPTGQTFNMTSSLIRGSVRFSPLAMVSRASVEATDPTFTSNNPQINAALGNIAAEKLGFHMRPNPTKEGDLDLSIDASELATGQFPIISGQLSLTAIDGLTIALQNQNDPAGAWLAQSGRIEKINGWVEIGQKTLKLNGDVSFANAGLANGLLKLRILNPTAENANVTKQLSAERDGLNGPLTALQLMGKPVKDGELIGSEVEIKLNEGQVRAGLLPLGSIPPIR